MNTEYIISDEVLETLNSALAKDENWMAYNTGTYFLETGEVCFFKNKASAYEFAENNISDCDSFKVIRFDSIADVLLQIPYGKEFERKLTDPDANGLYNRDGNAFTDAMIDHLEKEQIANNKKYIFMNEKNYEYLTEQLKRTGFGDTFNNELRENMEKQNAEFTLTMQKSYGTDNVKATLHFKKSDESDMVFFNKYDLELKKQNNDNSLRQTFYPNKGITLKEGYNLLDGRAIHKTLTNKQNEKYNTWLQLDFKDNTESGNYVMKQYHQNYGFDLGKTLSKYPIKELSDEKFKEDLIKSLERGNLQSATFSIDGREEKIFITPNVVFKTLHAFDAQMQKISLNDIVQKNKQEQTNKVDNKQEVSEKPQEKKTSKIKNDRDSPARRNRKKQKVTQ